MTLFTFNGSWTLLTQSIPCFSLLSFKVSYRVLIPPAMIQWRDAIDPSLDMTIQSGNPFCSFIWLLCTLSCESYGMIMCCGQSDLFQSLMTPSLTASELTDSSWKKLNGLNCCGLCSWHVLERVKKLTVLVRSWSCHCCVMKTFLEEICIALRFPFHSSEDLKFSVWFHLSVNPDVCPEISYNE